MNFEAAARAYSAYKSSGIVDEIHANDTMARGDQKSFYFKVGDDAIRVIFSALTLTWKQSPKRVLDMPCGHGRVARHLQAAFPDARLFVSDLDEEGTMFCADRFNAEPVVSKPNLTEVAFPANLDLIWIGSLFTHIDRKRTISWLTHLSTFLSEKGLIVATFKGMSQRELRNAGNVDYSELWRTFDETGFGYTVYPGFEDQDYGTTLVRPSAILTFAEKIPCTRIINYTERGWANRQDVLVLSRHERTSET